MKKVLCAYVIAAICGLTSVSALASQSNGGFVDSTAQQTTNPMNITKLTDLHRTVEQAKQLRDDVYVILEGNVVKKIGDDKYSFKDSTDSITVEIDHEVWRGVTVNPQIKIRLLGKVEHKLMGVKIDVKQLELAE